MNEKLTLQATTDRNNCLQANPGMSAECQAVAQKAINQLTRTTSQFLTFGVRARPVERVILELGVDVGLQSPGYQYGPAIPKWNVIFGLGYAFDFTGSTTKNVTRTITRTYEITRKPPPEGKVSGTVLDVKTGKPVAGAVIRYGGAMTPQATDDKGQFTSYGPPPGQGQRQGGPPAYEPGPGG